MEPSHAAAGAYGEDPCSHAAAGCHGEDQPDVEGQLDGEGQPDAEAGHEGPWDGRNQDYG